jgi:A/G-specific adenine glycosylase
VAVKGKVADDLPRRSARTDTKAFRRLIWDYYVKHGRVLPWRLTNDPYRILVSEIMLQQTGVDRVSGRYERFIDTFPDFPSLARAPLDAVLGAWQGLGYNRRALSLRQTAARITEEFLGTVPCSPETLVTLPGIGRATAGAIVAFAFNHPVVFIETNIRTVFIHFFFRETEKVGDDEILPLVARTLDRNDPRGWYYALMDYGAMLKKQGERGYRKSEGYHKQAPFRGSDRQVRGAILKLLVEGKTLSEAGLTQNMGAAREKIRKILLDLQKEGFLRESEEGYIIA